VEPGGKAEALALKNPLTILHSEWSVGWGGQEIRILTVSEGMAARGHRILVATRPQAPMAREARALGLEVFHLSMCGPWDPVTVWKLARLLKREKVHILNTHSSVDSWLGIYAARLAGTPLVRTRHCGSVRVHPFNLVYKAPDAYITVGEGIRRELLAGYGIPQDKITSIATGVDPRRFVPADPDPGVARELGLEPGQPVVSMVAMLRSWKRHDLFCQMAARLLERMPQTKFLIVGDGPRREHVERYLDQMNLRHAVIMTGYRKDVERILPLVTVSVLTSQGEEGAAQVLSQAMACERAVVSADQGSVSDLVINEQTGLLVPFGDVDAFAAAVERLLKDEELRKRLARQGRDLVLRQFTRESTIDATEEVYARMLARRGPAPYL
jgi:glycosyltransferase involved in cell wall biosynthesis